MQGLESNSINVLSAILSGRVAEVPDPEIPVISVSDLGIVRALRWDGDTLVVAVEKKVLVLGTPHILTLVVQLVQIIVDGDQQRQQYHGMMDIGLLCRRWWCFWWFYIASVDRIS